MPPFSKALNSVYPTDDPDVFAGDIDSDWCNGGTPNGGYTCALLLHAAILRQQSKKEIHSDVLHVTSHYLRAVSIAPFVIRLTTLKTGRIHTNIQGQLIQKDQICLFVHIIFSAATTPPTTELTKSFTLPSPHARLIPLKSHPSLIPVNPMPAIRRCRDHVKWAQDESIIGPNGEHGGFRWGGWVELTDEETLTPPMVLFLCDFTSDRTHGDARRKGDWYPTLVLSVYFMSPVPAKGLNTTGLISSSQFMHDPHGRHEEYAELWTSPCSLSNPEDLTQGWESEQRCLAISTQMALCMPIIPKLGMEAITDRLRNRAKL